jgi:hypothetical protein
MGKGKKKKISTPAQIASDLAACKLAFEQVNIPWVITDGIVLGYARNKEIMPWDTDLDMGVFVEITDKQWNSIYKSLLKNGFRIKRPTRDDFIWGTRQSKLNLWLFHKSGDFYEAFPRTTRGFKFVEKAKWYDEPQMVDFLGSKYPMPNHIDDYLDHRYGPDWKTNIVKDHDKFFEQKRGNPRNVPEWKTNRIRKEDGRLWWPVILKKKEKIKKVMKGTTQ